MWAPAVKLDNDLFNQLAKMNRTLRRLVH